MLKADVRWPRHRRYKSRTEWEPVGFFSDCLCNSTHFDLMLGFFSSSAISVLSDGFAVFLYNNGYMRLIINDVLTEEDRNAISLGIGVKEIPYFDLNNIEAIKAMLSERDVHFFECLSWLIRNNRIEIKIIAPKESIGISHTKSGVFSDGLNEVGFDGSCNFSRAALLDNIESLSISCDWDGSVDSARIDGMKEDFNRVFDGKDDSVVYVNSENVKTRLSSAFPEKTIADLLDDEYHLLKNSPKSGMATTAMISLSRAKDRIEAIIEKKNILEEQRIAYGKQVPRFPYASGPRDYQRQAFENWKNNKQKGLFAMATGTGKTITSLNCLLEIYNHSGYYKALILVPTITLVEQWEIECRKFNFDNIIKVCSKYSNWKSAIGNLRLLEQNPNNNHSYIIISTYASFVRSNVFDELCSLSRKKLLLIADEAHNMGAGRVAQRLNDIPYVRRIGLSATPQRQYDDLGNAKIREFFGSIDNYTFEYSMRDAIQNGALCKYFYYPHLVELTPDEFAEYVELSKKIAKIFDNDDPDSQDILKRLLLKRKRIIHKAANKKKVFTEILQDRIKTFGSLKYTLVYVPEGNLPDDQMADVFDTTDAIGDDEDSVHIIDEFTAVVRDIDDHVVVRQFIGDTPDRDQILKDFADGKIDVLTSMKCLDEGVDVPRSEFAVFCSSTGNPRQFIQRRGRVLRTHKDKHCAIIHDLVVIPGYLSNEDTYEMERNLVGTEVLRVRDFALLSENCNDTLSVLDDVLTRYNISLFK